MAEPIVPPPIDIAHASLAEIAAAVAAKRLPPVEQWNPEHCGDIDMRIAADGTWFHAGSPIGRPAMVRLFSTILRREPDGSYVLVTPVEKLNIMVEDAPFVAVELTSEGAGKARNLAFRLNTDEVVIAGPDHPLRVETAPDGNPRPYLHVRGKVGNGLEALLNRPVFYELAELALAETPPDDRPGLWSGGAFFAFAD
ncbi:MAG: DUF1285 domain-containing protein [Sphingomonadaceae bacterium]